MKLSDKKTVGSIIIFLFLGLGLAKDAIALDEKLPILIISSYNPETSSTSNNILAFQEACDSLGISNNIVIENMNCKNFAESKLWKSRFQGILSKYINWRGKLNVSSLVLLGQESWSAYLSQNIELLEEIPVVVGMVSSNGLILPNDNEDLATWAPAPLYFSDLYKRKNILSGIAYNYDVSQNIDMAMNFYPKLENIALLTDNTFGGVVLQSHVKAIMAKHKNINLLLLDGRVNDIYEIQNKLANMPVNTVLFLGTWRVDKKESYFMSSSLYTMMAANPQLPTFSLTTLGLGNWAIGGLVPNYRNQGRLLAIKLKEILNNDSLTDGVRFMCITNNKRYDIKKIREFKLKENFTNDAILINDDKSLLDKYPSLIYIITIILSLLGVAFIFVSFYLFKIKKLNMYLTSSEDNNRMILNNIGVGLFFINKDFEVLWENCSALEGMEAWSFVKVGCRCYISKDNGERPCKKCPTLNFSTDYINVHKEIIERRDHRVYSLLYTPISNNLEEYIGCVVRIEDVTMREKTNIELHAAKEAAENADKLKSQFLANMSHEIRTPLNAIVGFSELLADIDDPIEKREFIKIIEANNRQLLQLINDILDLSKIEAGTLEFHLEQVDMSHLIEELYQIFLPACNDKGIELIKDIPSTGYCFLSDRNRIAQVVSNFITNAIKFTSKGHIKIGFIERENDIKIYVEDTGIGISEEKRRTVFERFVKLNSFAQGTGLGLSICMMIVSRLGGEIDVDSTKETGSTFWFTIPKNPGGGGGVKAL
ncbi:MAG: HAMP domain-containing sensor histidine kinase [Bacteroidales bacterium]